jgi:hypothetical protein
MAYTNGQPLLTVSDITWKDQTDFHQCLGLLHPHTINSYRYRSTDSECLPSGGVFNMTLMSDVY